MPRSAPTVHLLVPSPDRQRLLVAAPADGGELLLPVIEPRLGQDEALVTALQRHLRVAWDLDPAILETHVPPRPAGEENIGLAVLEAPPAQWAPPAHLAWSDEPPELQGSLAPRARSWLAEWASAAPPAELRPRWSRPGWQARATSWIRASLAAAGRPAAGEIEMRRLWAISALARVPLTDGGAAWFKAVFPHFGHEPAATALLHDMAPSLVAPVIAIERDEGWLLLEEAGAPVPDNAGRGADETLDAIGLLVEAQGATRRYLADFAALGCPRRPLTTLADTLAEVLAEAGELEGPHVSPARADRVLAWVREGAAWLAGLGFPEVLVHGDFHPGNLLIGDGGIVVVDWSDAAIAHPVMELGAWVAEVDDPRLRSRGWSAWLEAWSRLGPADSLRGQFETVYALAAGYQAISYAWIVRNVEPASRYQLRGGFPGFWRDLDERVPA